MSYENRVCNGNRLNGHGYGIEFYGSDGTLFVDREGFEITPERRNVSRNSPGEPRMEALAVKSTPDDPTHARNFIDCVKSRQLPICDIEIGHRSSTTAILGNLAYRSGATVQWDGASERVTNGNRKASELVTRNYRKPWELRV
jgi:hypothetical protein